MAIKIKNNYTTTFSRSIICSFLITFLVVFGKVVTVNAQVNLLDHFGIKKLFSVVGGSMGGMQVLQFVSNFPERAKTAVPIACTSNHSAQNIAFNELGRQAITADNNWSDGKYSSNDSVPDKGLAVARMAAHITYLSKKGLQEKFGRKLQERDDLKFGFDADFQIESYLR